MNWTVHFNKPSFVEAGTSYMAAALGSVHHSGDGFFSRRCHELLEEQLGVPRALLTTSCTHALAMAALLLDLQPGDEAIVPLSTAVT